MFLLRNKIFLKIILNTPLIWRHGIDTMWFNNISTVFGEDSVDPDQTFPKEQSELVCSVSCISLVIRRSFSFQNNPQISRSDLFQNNPQISRSDL